MGNKELVAIFEYMEREKGIKREVVAEAIKESLLAAARKSLNEAENVSVEVDPKTGVFGVFCEKQIVERVSDSSAEILLREAQELDPDCELGQFLDIEVTPDGFGRIAAQTARQIISQRLRSAERDVIYAEYRDRINELVSGTVKRFARGSNLIIDLGKIEAIMPARHYPKTETYHEGDRVHALLYAVQDLENGGAEVVLSRSAPEFVKQLFSQEVPEISDGTVSIIDVVREAGYRAKVVVRSSDMRVDPVGTCVGVRGSRVKTVVRELNNEKIDIIPWADDPVELLENALNPIEIRKVNVNEEDNTISIVVDDDDYPTVIGRRGMNARLNGALIGYQLEAQKMSEYQQLIAVQRRELAELKAPELDEPLTVKGISNLVIENFIEAGFNTPRKLFAATAEELETVPGVSPEVTERILEVVQLEHLSLLDSSEEEARVPETEEE
jgi:transcription termination/antitermination protein NusA